MFLPFAPIRAFIPKEMPAISPRTIRHFFLGVNYVALTGTLATWLYVQMAELAGRGNVTELDRAQVFDEAALRSYSPELADDIRYTLARWIQQPVYDSAIFLNYCIGGLAVLNIIGYHALNKLSETATEHESR